MSFKPRKSIKSRYSIKSINTNSYMTLRCTSDGYVWAPYKPISTASIISDGWEFSVEQIAEEKREVRKKKIDRIFKEKTT